MHRKNLLLEKKKKKRISKGSFHERKRIHVKAISIYKRKPKSLRGNAYTQARVAFLKLLNYIHGKIFHQPCYNYS